MEADGPNTDDPAMTAQTTSHPTPLRFSVVRAIRWGLIAEGVLVAAIGFLAIAFPIWAGFAATTLVGWTLLGIGFVRVAGAFARPRDEKLWAASTALLTLALGGLILYAPVASAVGATILIAAYLFTEGVLAVFETNRRRGRGIGGWLLVAAIAVVDWTLALLLLFIPPAAGELAFGLIVGGSFIAGGAILVVLGLSPSTTAMLSADADALSPAATERSSAKAERTPFT
jgi:uncharacterized membrane protein HdeD (DUF308 family)